MRDNLHRIMFEAKKYSIPIYISDNSLDDQTKKIVTQLSLSYDFLFYEKNLKDVGNDKNILYSLGLPKSDYVWLLGDALEIYPFAFKKIINIIEKYEPDLIAVNSVGRDLHYKEGVHSHIEVFLNLGWHLTLTGATIYSRDAINSIDRNKILKSENFPQMPLIFNYLACRKRLYWVNDKVIVSSKKKKSYWVAKVFSIFIKDWSYAVYALSDSYDNKFKREVVLQHSHKTNIFGFKSLVSIRLKKAYDYKVLSKYKNLLVDHSNLNYLVLFLIAIFPVFILKHIRNAYTKFN